MSANDNDQYRLSSGLIKKEFLTSLENHISDSNQQSMLWNEVEKNYSGPSRHYHNLQHLDSLVEELKACRASFSSWDTVVFAIAYHDIVYNIFKSNNEQKSADFAVKRLSAISFPENLTAFCAQLINATKKHEAADPETNLFTDADLSILGAEPERYQSYTSQIRREYSAYPDMLYNPGRKKVLLHFLNMKNIYKTSHFSSRYESNARINIAEELKSLTNDTI